MRRLRYPFNAVISEESTYFIHPKGKTSGAETG
jgi:hypothetical protein